MGGEKRREEVSLSCTEHSERLQSVLLLGVGERGTRRPLHLEPRRFCKSSQSRHVCACARGRDVVAATTRTRTRTHTHVCVRETYSSSKLSFSLFFSLRREEQLETKLKRTLWPRSPVTLLLPSPRRLARHCSRLARNACKECVCSAPCRRRNSSSALPAASKERRHQRRVSCVAPLGGVHEREPRVARPPGPSLLG